MTENEYLKMKVNEAGRVLEVHKMGINSGCVVDHIITFSSPSLVEDDGVSVHGMNSGARAIVWGVITSIEEKEYALNVGITLAAQSPYTGKVVWGKEEARIYTTLNDDHARTIRAIHENQTGHKHELSDDADMAVRSAIASLVFHGHSTKKITDLIPAIAAAEDNGRKLVGEVRVINEDEIAVSEPIPPKLDTRWVHVRVSANVFVEVGGVFHDEE